MGSKMELSAEEKIFLKEIESNLDDDSARLVYADWLEERGDPRGEYLRLEYELISGDGTTDELSVTVERINRLNQSIAPDWLALVSRAAIEGCHANYLETRKCVGRWRKLQKTDQPTIRACHNCGNAVHFCTDLRNAKWLHRRQGSRVAVESTLERSRDDLRRPGVSQPQPEELPTLTQRLATAEQLLRTLHGNSGTRRKSLWQRFRGNQDFE